MSLSPRARRRLLSFSWVGQLRKPLQQTLQALVGAAFATLVLRYLIPVPAAAGTPLFALARLGTAKPMLLWVPLCLGCTAALQYWKTRWFEDPTQATTVATRAHAGASFAALLGLAIIAAWFFRGSLVEFYRVDGCSMLPTLEAGDRLVTSKFAFGFKPPWRAGAAALPERGDIIVFTSPRRLANADTPLQLVKRVIGLPGDRIRMRGAEPVINDWDVPSCFVGPYPYLSGNDEELGQLRVEYLGGAAHLALYSLNTANFAGEYTVSEDEVFVLGDNRANSDDSRSFGGGHGGGVPRTLIKGRAARFLSGTQRDATRQGGGQGSTSFAELGQAIDAAMLVSDFNLEGMQLDNLRRKVADCLEHPPAQTSPPTADARQSRR